ncbi:MAG: DUF6172 family protein [Campylobacterales bacterium]|nr:DUF6172 family protein [Campylobacterales bacterium]
MKKTYQLIDEKQNLDRIVESIKNDVRKYIKREKRKTLQDEHIWMFDCKSAINDEEIKEIKFTDITNVIDEAADNNAKTIYIELISKEVKRAPKKVVEKIEDETEVETEVESDTEDSSEQE